MGVIHSSVHKHFPVPGSVPAPWWNWSLLDSIHIFVLVKNYCYFKKEVTSKTAISFWHLSVQWEVFRKTFDEDSGKRLRPEDSTAVRAEITVGESALHAHGWPVGLRKWIDREEMSQWWPEKWEDKGIVTSIERLLCAMLWKFTQQSKQGNTPMIPILQMKKLRHREVYTVSSIVN